MNAKLFWALSTSALLLVACSTRSSGPGDRSMMDPDAGGDSALGADTGLPSRDGAVSDGAGARDGTILGDDVCQIDVFHDISGTYVLGFTNYYDDMARVDVDERGRMVESVAVLDDPGTRVQTVTTTTDGETNVRSVRYDGTGRLTGFTDDPGIVGPAPDVTMLIQEDLRESEETYRIEADIDSDDVIDLRGRIIYRTCGELAGSALI